MSAAPSDPSTWTEENHPPRVDCVLICGGVWHDMDFARLELLKLLAEDPRVRTRVFEDYENIEAIKAFIEKRDPDFRQFRK